MANLRIEKTVQSETNCQLIAGLDEAGRGALAGPVVAAAVILPLFAPDCAEQFSAVDDSKKLTAEKREHLFSLIINQALSYGVGVTAAEVIDEIGILPATRRAMVSALAQLTPPPDYLLIDGRIRLAQTNLPQQSIIRGDGKSLSIAAASILAKVTRDEMMIGIDKDYSPYGFARHKGYGTQFHRDMIAKHGPTPVHRHSFAPIRKPLL